MNGKNEKSVSKLAKLPSLRPLALNGEFLLEFKFLKNYKDAAGGHEQVLLTSNFFPYKSFKFPQNSSCHKKLTQER